MSENVKTSLHVLLSEIVDYAGLFPPAQLTMAAAVQNYADYQNHKYSWMLGRFIVPADLLTDFTSHAEPFWSATNSKLWRVSVLGRGSLSDTISQIEEFNQTHEGRAVIDTLEVRADSAAQIKEAKDVLSPKFNIYFEIPLSNVLPEQMAVLASMKSRAKIRTGGITQEAIPPVDEIVKFLRVCIAANVPFKATAGLHHPLRSTHPLTYEHNAPTGAMHGFLNLFLSAAFMRLNLNNTFVHKLLADGNPANFVFDDDGANWNGNRIDLAQLKLTRERNAISFGSCSFIEPIEDLQQLGFI